jgi:prepilin-type N-terminal cleavage/methylation domain-containing protein
MRQKGFTLVELMIAATIVGIILAFTMPGFVGYLQDMNQKQARATLIESVRIARQTAVTQHAPVIMTFGTGGVNTNVTKFTIHVDNNNNRTVDAGESFTTHNLPSGTKFSKVTLTPNDSLVFDISGVLWPGTSGGNIIVNGRVRPDTLYVSAAGIVYQP